MKLIENIQDILKALKVECSVEQNSNEEDLESWEASEDVVLEKLVHISKVKVSVESFDGVLKKVDGYAAWMEIIIPQTYEEPADSDIIELEVSNNFRSVVMKAVDAVLNYRIDELLEERMFCEGDWY